MFFYASKMLVLQKKNPFLLDNKKILFLHRKNILPKSLPAIAAFRFPLLIIAVPLPSIAVGNGQQWHEGKDIQGLHENAPKVGFCST